MTLIPEIWQDKQKQLGFTHLTTIQEKLLSPILDGKSVLGISPTGSGKTLAYLWPSLLRLKPKKAQQLLILAPNTELAGQIFEVTKEWASPLNLSAQLFLSGSSQKRQIERLKKGPEILIGTPGRILELAKLKKIKLMAVETIVLDEYDELLNDSQYPFVNTIINHVPRDHQMIYLSATQAVDHKTLEKETLILDCSDDAPEQTTHVYLKVDKRDRLDLLRKLSNLADFRALVFFNSLSDLGATEERLQFRGQEIASLASDVNIKERKQILEAFKNHTITLLLATDLVARGIDIDNLEAVINYDIPRDKDNYIHRAGRTGRMGKTGLVINFVTHKEELKTLKKYQKVSEVQFKNQTFIFSDQHSS